MMDLNEFKREVHQNALNHGFWKHDYSDAVVLCLIQTEISEAFEEWRARRPMVWHRCRANASGELVICERCVKCVSRATATSCPDYCMKPEGVAVELADVALRILDAAGAWNLSVRVKQIQNIYVYDEPIAIENAELPEVVWYLHKLIARVDRHRVITVTDYMSLALGVIFSWLTAQGYDPEALLKAKHIYNQTRDKMHGGKRV